MRKALLLLLLFLASSAEAANEIQFHYDTSPSTSKVWDVTNTAWATWSDGNIDDYDLPLTSRSGMYFSASFPTDITTAGRYAVSIHEQDGASPATDDLLIGSGVIEWDGTAERHLAAVQLADDGIDNIPTTAPSGVASDFREMLVQLWRRFFKKTVLTSTALMTYADDGTTVLTTQTVSETSTSQTS